MLSKLHEVVTNAHDLAPTTRDRYLRDLNQWCAYAGEDPTHWTNKRLAEFYATLLKRPMKAQSANRLIASVRYASYWWAQLEGNPSLHFAEAVRMAKAKDKKPQIALDQDGVTRLLATCDRSLIGARDFALLVVGLETGMRRSSLGGMTIEDTICGVDARWPYPAARVPIKGKDPAWVPLSDTAVLAIQPWRVMLHALLNRGWRGPLFRGLRRRAVGHGRVELVPSDDTLSPSAIAKILSERATAAGLPHVNPHRLRHTFVTLRAAQPPEGAGLKPFEIAAITHHDMGSGALGGYMDRQKIGEHVRNSTPPWLAELVRAYTSN